MEAVLLFVVVVVVESCNIKVNQTIRNAVILSSEKSNKSTFCVHQVFWGAFYAGALPLLLLISFFFCQESPLLCSWIA